jgi:TPR repeat protein
MRERRDIKSRAVETWVQADKQWESGRLNPAFRLMLSAAKMGESGAQVNVGYMYDKGIGTRHNKQAALYWYKRAYRRGESCAAHNIGTVWRDDGNFSRALYWFERATQLNGGDDGEANFEIAKLYLERGNDPRKAVFLLRKVCKSKNVTQHCVEQARRLLKRTIPKGRLRA